MKSYVFLLIGLIALLPITVAQDLDIPSEDVFLQASDYEKYEPQVEACIDWLVKTPLGYRNGVRKIASQFFVKWATGTNKTSIGLDGDVMTFTTKNPDLLVVYMAGWSAYELKYGKDQAKAKHAGLKAVLKVYEQSPNRVKDPVIEKMLKKMKKGKLKM